LLNRNRLANRLDEELGRLRAPAGSPNLRQTIAEIGARLLDCEKAVFFTYHEGQKVLEISAFVGLPAELSAQRVAVSEALQALVQPGARRCILPPIDVSGWGARNAKIRGRVLGVPIKLNGQLEHVLLLGEPRNRPFGEIEEEFIERLAHHAAVALETAHLLDPAQRRYRALQTLQKIGDYIQSATDEDKIFHAVLTGITAGYGLGRPRADLSRGIKTEQIVLR